MSDIEGKTAREAASEWNRRASHDIDGKTERSNGREHMSQCGQRASFNQGKGRMPFASSGQAHYAPRSKTDSFAQRVFVSERR